MPKDLVVLRVGFVFGVGFYTAYQITWIAFDALRIINQWPLG